MSNMRELLKERAKTNPDIYHDRAKDLFTDHVFIYQNALIGKISWEEACNEMEETAKFYHGSNILKKEKENK